MNQPNTVTRKWLSNRFEVDRDEYTVFDCRVLGQLCLGISQYGKYIEVVVFENNPRRKYTGIGKFSFERKRIGGVIAYAPEYAQIIPAYQGQGIGPLVYKFLAKCGWVIRSGSTMSAGAAKMWSRLTSEKDFDVMNCIKGKWYTVEDIEPSDVYEENVFVLFAK